MQHIEPSVSCLEELNTVSVLESGVQVALTKSTRTCKMKPVPDATLGQADLTSERRGTFLLNEREP